MLVATVVMFFDTDDIAACAAVAEATSVMLKIDRVLARFEMLSLSAVALTVKVFLEFVIAVFKPATVFKFSRISLGSNTLTPKIGNSIEYFLDESDALNIAGLKNGAVDGSSTATPVPPIAIERGSNELNGIAAETPLISINAMTERLKPAELPSFIIINLGIRISLSANILCKSTVD
jgi:hypothetical protein